MKDLPLPLVPVENSYLSSSLLLTTGLFHDQILEGKGSIRPENGSGVFVFATLKMQSWTSAPQELTDSVKARHE